MELERYCYDGGSWCINSRRIRLGNSKTKPFIEDIQARKRIKAIIDGVLFLLAAKATFCAEKSLSATSVHKGDNAVAVHIQISCAVGECSTEVEEGAAWTISSYSSTPRRASTRQAGASPTC